MLADSCLTAVAVYRHAGGKLRSNPAEAMALMTEVMVDMNLAKARFLAPKTLLEQQPTVAAGEIAAIGYCFGGTTVLNMARAGVDLKAVVSFHGLLNTKTPAQPGQVKARVLVETGADDPMAPPADVAALKQEMVAAGVDHEVHAY